MRYKATFDNKRDSLEPKRLELLVITENDPKHIKSVRITPGGKGFVVYLHPKVSQGDIPLEIRKAIKKCCGKYNVEYMFGGNTGANFIPSRWR